jgi:subtilisin family serine protease
MKTKIIASSILLAMLFIAVFPVSTFASTPSIRVSNNNPGFTVDPAKVELVGTASDPLPPGATPFNLDMVDAEKVCETGDGIYVAVLDTGLLSNYKYFFPEGVVDIKEEWGIGYSHNVWYDPTGEGNWSIEYIDGVEYRFSYGEVLDDRGFITHDNGAPDKYGFGWGSGHGTHVTSIITGWYLNRGGVEYWVKGVAPKVTIIPVLVLDDWIEFADDGNGWMWTGGTDEMVAAGIRYIGDLAKAHHVKIVINMSLGGPTPTDIIEDAIDYAICKGVIVVASAGNEGEAGMGWPGAYPQVISAAAAGWTQEYISYYTGDLPDPWYWWTKDVPEKLWTTDPLGNEFQVYLTDFSSRPNPDLGQSICDLDVAAPGAGIKGPFKNYGSGQWGYYSVWGTSQAAPHVSAIAALVLQNYKKVDQFGMQLCLKAAGLLNRMTKLFEETRSAVIFDIFSGDLLTFTWTWKDYGTGLLQADEAIRIAKLIFGFKGKLGPCGY